MAAPKQHEKDNDKLFHGFMILKVIVFIILKLINKIDNYAGLLLLLLERLYLLFLCYFYLTSLF